MSLKFPISLEMILMKLMKLSSPLQSSKVNLGILPVTSMVTVTMSHCQNYRVVKVIGIMLLSILYLKISQVLMIMLT